MLDSMFPMPMVVEALAAFTERFPVVPPRVYVQSFGAAAELVIDGTCMIGLLSFFFTDPAAFRRFPLLTIDLVSVVAPSHPLAGAYLSGRQLGSAGRWMLEHLATRATV